MPFVFREACASIQLSEKRVNHVHCQQGLKPCILKAVPRPKPSCSLPSVGLKASYEDGNTTGKLRQSPFWHLGVEASALSQLERIQQWIP